MKIRNLLLVFTFLPLSLWLVLDGTILKSESFQKLNAPLSSIRKKTTSLGTRASIPTGRTDHHDAPLFVLHIGPPKTATSTIQGYAREHEEILKKDNIYYLGHDTTRSETRLHELSKFCRKCEYRDCSQCSKRWEDFERTVNDHFDKNHNVFLSDETFNRFFNDGEKDEKAFLWDRLEPLLSRWNVRIIMTYRRYFEWVPSTYFQSYHPDGAKSRSKWPEDGGGVIPSFPEFLDTFIATNKMKQPFVIKKKWEEHFSDVWVCNMHEGSDFISDFYCQMIPEANQLCDHLMSHPVSITKNPSSSKLVHYDMLAVAAHQQGLVNKNLSRTAVAEAVKQKSTELGLLSVVDFSTDCLTKAQSGRFLNMSLHFELETVPEFHLSPKGAAEHKAYYNEALKAGKFCSIKPEVVLDDKSWQSFFKKLGMPEEQTRSKAVKDKGKKDAAQFKSQEANKSNGPVAVNHTSMSTDASDKANRRTPMLCLYTGDEGSTVLSEALRLHPQVYSPDWKVEPANAAQLNKRGVYTLDAQLDAIRFLLQMPSYSTVYRYRKNPMTLASYDARMGNAEATYLKAAVCRDARKSKEGWSICVKDVLSNLLCGAPGDTVQHLILPVRYGFDRACSILVHRDKELYMKYSQFHDANTTLSKNSLVSITEGTATALRRLQERYIRNFMEVVRLTQDVCPEQKHRAKLHVFDYDAAKQVGIEKALKQVFVDLGLRHSDGDLNLGRFGQRKPGNYCERIFDSKSKALLRQNEAAYKKWLKSTCIDTPTHAWCANK